MTQLTRGEFLKFVALMRHPWRQQPVPNMCLDLYLATVSTAYGAVFMDPDWPANLSRYTQSHLQLLQYEGITPASLPACNPYTQYQALADGRHGGLLDLPSCDAEAFSTWYSGNARLGQHPYEIIAGDERRGITLRVDPTPHDIEGWNFELSVHVTHLYAIAVRMSLTLHRARVPFAFRDHERVIGGLVLTRCPARRLGP